MSLSASDLANSCHSAGHALEDSASCSGFAKAARPPAGAAEPDERISLADIHAVLDWCAVLGCTEDELRDAVRTAGPRVQSVKRALGKGLYSGSVVGHLLR